MKKEIPILFSTEMVRAILEGRKTMTRRIVKAGFNCRYKKFWKTIYMEHQPDLGLQAYFHDEYDAIGVKCPYGKPGDLLWVRESFLCGNRMDDNDSFEVNENGEYVHETWYRASTPNLRWFDGTSDFPMENPPWKPSIHMPKSACRIWLQVEDVRVERLQDITEEDALAEGIEELSAMLFGNPQYMNYVSDEPFTCPIYSFQSLWHAINGKESWDANPWVWVVKYKVLSTTGKPEIL